MSIDFLRQIINYCYEYSQYVVKTTMYMHNTVSDM